MLGLPAVGHGDLRELLLQGVRDDLLVLHRVDLDLGGGGRAAAASRSGGRQQSSSLVWHRTRTRGVGGHDRVIAGEEAGWLLYQRERATVEKQTTS